MRAQSTSQTVKFIPLVDKGKSLTLVPIFRVSTEKQRDKGESLDTQVADFKADKQSGKAPLSVKFMDKSKGDAITEWSWDFNNDGVIDSTEKNPSYTYTSKGNYNVSLTVTNAGGSNTRSIGFARLCIAGNLLWLLLSLPWSLFILSVPSFHLG